MECDVCARTGAFKWQDTCVPGVMAIYLKSVTRQECVAVITGDWCDETISISRKNECTPSQRNQELPLRARTCFLLQAVVIGLQSVSDEGHLGLSTTNTCGKLSVVRQVAPFTSMQNAPLHIPPIDTVR